MGKSTITKLSEPSAAKETVSPTLLKRCQDFAADLFVEHRSLFVICFLLPASFLFSLFQALSTRLSFYLNSSPALHSARVEKIQAQVGRANADGKQMCTNRPTWLAMSVRNATYKSRMAQIDVNLPDILEINEAENYVRVEPLVTMGQITRCLGPLGLTLAIVPELDDLTVGGLISGFGVETSSFRFGLFQHICLEYEVVLPNGEVETCSATKNPELFSAIPWSHGTLGFLVSAKIRTIKAGKWVELNYTRHHTASGMVEETQRQARRTDYENVQFVETLAFSATSGVVMTGRLVDKPDHSKGTVNRIGRWHKPWFYEHVESFLSLPSQPSTPTTESGTPAIITEYIPLRHYYHRHSRSIFWELRDIIPLSSPSTSLLSTVFRWTLGWLCPPKISLLKLTTTGKLQVLYTEKHVVQDMLVPIKDLGESLDVFHDEFAIYPLWLCPMRIPRNVVSGAFIRPLNEGEKDEDDMFIDIGAYGNPEPANPAYRPFSIIDSLRRVEAFVRRVKGFQALYADTYMSESEFREMFDHALYDRLRKKVGAEGRLPSVYGKVALKSRR